MKILQAMAGAEFGGAEAFFVRLVLAFATAGVEQRVVIRENAKRANLLKAGGVDAVQLPFGGRFDWKTSRTLKREINDFKPDVVLSWMNRATSLCPSGNFVHCARLGGYYDLKYYRRCKHLIGNTRDIVDYLVEQGWPMDRAHYLPNFVSSGQVEPVPRSAFFTPKGVPVIFGMGRLHENKAFDVLLRAICRVPDAYLWIAGDGPLRGELETLAEKLGVKPRVRFLGWRDDTAALLAAADLFVCPSRHEPLGNVVLEAWAQGIPVIAADSMGPGTLIEHLENGVLVPVDDDNTMGRAIRSVLDDDSLRDKISRRGYEAFEAQFTEAQVVRQYLDFFAKVSA